MIKLSRSKASWLLLASATTLLAGCGKGSAPPPKANTEQVVFVTSEDCAATKKLEIADCNLVLDMVLKEHLAKAPKYKLLTSCEKAEGASRCEKADETTYRPRLIASAVIVADVQMALKKKKPVPVTPLYATMGGEPGFRTLAKSMLKGDDETIVFTERAVAVYTPFVKVKGKKKV